MNNVQLMDLLAQVSQVGWTKWSNVYGLIDLNAYIIVNRNYNIDPYIFSL